MAFRGEFRRGHGTCCCVDGGSRPEVGGGEASESGGGFAFFLDFGDVLFFIAVTAFFFSDGDS